MLAEAARQRHPGWAGTELDRHVGELLDRVGLARRLLADIHTSFWWTTAAHRYRPGARSGAQVDHRGRACFRAGRIGPIANLQSPPAIAPGSLNLPSNALRSRDSRGRAFTSRIGSQLGAGGGKFWNQARPRRSFVIPRVPITQELFGGDSQNSEGKGEGGRCLEAVAWRLLVWVVYALAGAGSRRGGGPGMERAWGAPRQRAVRRACSWAERSLMLKTRPEIERCRFARASICEARSAFSSRALPG